ncbi:MAG: response regulator [Proteobacteria bacterium]|nr:response regulator [Pseudomonadota bacterium]MBU1737528.1 response regulator [Pseudomonadota bacterium]
MNNGSILILDDSRSVLSFLENLFTAAGYRVHTAINGREGWDFLQKNKNIDLVFSDLEMPVMNGLELCRLVKGDSALKGVYFIIYTTHKALNEKVEGLTIGADDYIEKTTRPEEILARIKAGMRVRLLQDELKNAHRRIYQHEKMASIGQLAAGVAHEINNPLGFITSNLSTLRKYLDRMTRHIDFLQTQVREEAADRVKQQEKQLKIDYILQDAHDLINESLEGAERVVRIVQGLKTFSRVDDATSKPVDINASLDSAINMIWNELKHNATLTRDYSDLPETTCNGQQLNQVFLNLLVNAVHSIADHGKIKISTRHENGWITVAITDTGCGIPPENINRLFEPFFTTKEIGKGTGLGLSISYEIIQKHGGDITVESTPGKGSTFTVRLPVRHENTKPEKKPAGTG